MVIVIRSERPGPFSCSASPVLISPVRQTETMLKTAEDLAGPYVWGQYDVLVLPPSFPYGGMENPCLTFATPTVLVSPNTPTTPGAASCDCPVDQLFPVSLLRLETNPCLE